MMRVMYVTEEADEPCDLATLLEANLDTFTYEDVAALGYMRPGDERAFPIGGGVSIVRAVDARVEQLRAEIAALADGADVEAAPHVAFPFGVWVGGVLGGLGQTEIDALEDALSTIRGMP